MTSNQGTFVLTIPAGSVTETTTIMFDPAPPENIPPPVGSHSLGSFTLTAVNAAGDQVTRFDPPLRIQIRYDPATLDPTSQESITIHFWNGVDKWVAVPTTLDTVANIATAEVDHFTLFALFAQIGPTATPSPSATPTPTPSATPSVTAPATPTSTATFHPYRVLIFRALKDSNPADW